MGKLLATRTVSARVRKEGMCATWEIPSHLKAHNTVKTRPPRNSLVRWLTAPRRAVTVSSRALRATNAPKSFASYSLSIGAETSALPG